MNPETVDEIRVIYNLHRGFWEDGMIEPPFRFYYEKILHPRERQVVDMKINGLTAGEIAIQMGISPLTVRRYIYNIKYIYRNKCRGRVYDKSWRYYKRRQIARDFGL